MRAMLRSSHRRERRQCLPHSSDVCRACAGAARGDRRSAPCWLAPGLGGCPPSRARAGGAPAFTMNQLAAFVAVAEAGTISGAAERLHVSPSALSAAVTELE